MTAFFPADHVRRATEHVTRSALPGAPIRQPAPATTHDSRCRRTLGQLLISLGRRLYPASSQLRPPASEPASAPFPWEDPDPHAAWRDAAALCADALGSWQEAASANRAEAHAVYRAALEREEAAARELARFRGRRRGARQLPAGSFTMSSASGAQTSAG
jgi:hypothetical protein